MARKRGSACLRSAPSPVFRRHTTPSLNMCHAFPHERERPEDSSSSASFSARELQETYDGSLMENDHLALPPFLHPSQTSIPQIASILQVHLLAVSTPASGLPHVFSPCIKDAGHEKGPEHDQAAVQHKILLPLAVAQDLQEWPIVDQQEIRPPGESMAAT